MGEERACIDSVLVDRLDFEGLERVDEPLLIHDGRLVSKSHRLLDLLRVLKLIFLHADQVLGQTTEIANGTKIS